MRMRKFATRLAVAVIVVMGLPASVGFGSPALAPCVTEDSVTDCYWNADLRGSGGGRSFEVRSGVVHYADGETVAIPASELEGVNR